MSFLFCYDKVGNRYKVEASTGTPSCNRAPNAVNDSASTALNTAVTLDPRANDTDSDGDALTVTATTSAAHGSVTYTGTSVTYTPTAGYTGSDNFTYTVSDGHGGTATASVAVTVSAANPIAVNDSISVHTLGGVTSGCNVVLANDSDPNGYTISVSSFTNGATGTVASRTLLGKYQLCWTWGGFGSPNDSFTYTITNGHGGTATATVTVTYID